MSSIYLLTKNKDKLNVAGKVFVRKGIEVKPLGFEDPEIQADSSIEVASHAAMSAFKQYRRPLVREDHSFYLGELNFPGPYMSYMERSIPVDLLVPFLKSLDVRSGHFELAAAYVDKNGQLHKFSYQVPVDLDWTPKGSAAAGWATLMRIPGTSKVFSEYGRDERLDIWSKNYERIADLLLKPDPVS
mgnify:CR=1 FL=1